MNSSQREAIAIRAAQIRAAEEVVIAGIPADLKARLDEAQKRFETAGGCPTCGSKRLAVHYSGECCKDDLY